MGFGEKKSGLSDAKRIPEPARALLPKRGIVFISGGLMSPGRRLVIDIDRKKLDYGINEGPNSTPYGKLPKEGTRDITETDLERIISLANTIWASGRSFSNMPPNADFDVMLILADGGEFKMISSCGPPLEKVEELYTYIWSLISG